MNEGNLGSPSESALRVILEALYEVLSDNNSVDDLKESA